MIPNLRTHFHVPVKLAKSTIRPKFGTTPPSPSTWDCVLILSKRQELVTDMIDKEREGGGGGHCLLLYCGALEVDFHLSKKKNGMHEIIGVDPTSLHLTLKCLMMAYSYYSNLFQIFQISFS
jgi:hypothetical protein